MPIHEAGPSSRKRSSLTFADRLVAFEAAKDGAYEWQEALDPAGAILEVNRGVVAELEDLADDLQPRFEVDPCAHDEVVDVSPGEGTAHIVDPGAADQLDVRDAYLTLDIVDDDSQPPKEQDRLAQLGPPSVRAADNGAISYYRNFQLSAEGAVRVVCAGMPRPPSLMAQPTYLASQVSRYSRREFERALSERGLRLIHHGVLAALDDFGPLAQQQLADSLDHDKSHLVRHIDHLEGHGLVTRVPDPADRRRNQVALTDAGRILLREMQKKERRSKKGSWTRSQPPSRTRWNRSYIASSTPTTGPASAVDHRRPPRPGARVRPPPDSYSPL
jgi:MarR family transcriptional regulator, lower aerobic nicotinate degradation pathway regulator